MLEKPDLEDAKIVHCLRDEYGLTAAQVAFLPLGADVNTAVYRAVADQGTPYFVKLRRGVFDEITVAAPKLLHDQGIAQIMAPLASRSRQLSARVEGFNLTLYPFVEGHNGWEVALSDRNWVEYGAALKDVHTAILPAALKSRIPQENYSAHWRESVRAFQKRAEDTRFDDPVAAKLAALLKAKRGEISHLVRQAERLGSVLRTRTLELVLCHSDIHIGNLLIDASGALYIVDWDNPILAPKERDLMFIGAGMGDGVHTAQEEETLFYQGYGQTEIDPIALAYYRCERIVQDIAAYCEHILLTDEGGADREEGLQQLTSQFLPNNVVEVAFESEKRLPPELQFK